MKKLIILLLVLSVALASAQTASADIFTDIELKVNEYNDVSDQVPSFINMLLGNEVVHLVIEQNDGTELHIKAVTEDSVITTFEEIDAEDDIGATVVVGTDEDTTYEVLNSEYPLGTFVDAMDEDRIVIEPVGFTNSVTFAIANVLLKLSGVLGLI
ncbi:hypothetical protein [Methanolobus sp. WCC4]|uniref:hypothetical protein n=1 Tax=Methanolobus sp. WCC4 TaxID=3125784 RepID=UPI0030FA5C5C